MTQLLKYCDIPATGNRSYFFDHVHIVWNEQLTFHQHDAWEISYVITGSGSRITGDQVDIFSAGEIIFIPPNTPHCWTFDEFDHDSEGKIENITIIFEDTLLHNLENSFAETKAIIAELLNKKNVLKFGQHSLKKIQQHMLNMLQQTDIQKLSTLLQIIEVIVYANDSTEIIPQGTSKNSFRMQEINRFIINNYDKSVSLQDAASYVGMNKSAFCVFVKKEKGKSFVTLLNEYRIECACLMLRETNYSVSEILYAVGFNDIPYFNRLFRKIKGISPLHYKNKFKVSQSNHD